MIEHAPFLFSGDADTHEFSLEWLAEKRQKKPPVYASLAECQAKVEEQKKVKSFLSSWFPKRAKKEDLLKKKILVE